MQFTVLDFETTGLGPLDDIITGFFVTFNRDGEIVDSLDVKLKPTRWSKEAEAIHKIPESVANKFPDRILGLRTIAAYIKKNQDSVMICHANHTNVNKDKNGKVISNSTGYFDWSMLRCNFHCLSDAAYWYFNQLDHHINVVSTHTIAKNKLALENYKLNTIAFHFGLTFQHHDAKSDATVTMEIFKKLIDIKNITLEELINVGRYDKTTKPARLSRKGNDISTESVS